MLARRIFFDGVGGREAPHVGGLYARTSIYVHPYVRTSVADEQM